MSADAASARLIDVIGNPGQARVFDEAQWSGLITTARNANLLGALAERLKEAGIEPGAQARRHLDGARLLSERQHRSVLWEVHQLQAALGELNIPVVLLKGAAYVLSAEMVAKGRLFGDIDILVPRASLDAVESQLMLSGWISAKSSAYDQRYYRRWMHELPPMTHIRRGTVVDVHHTILPLTARNAPDPAQLIARAVPVSQPNLTSVRTPCPEDLVIHSITHLVHEGELHNGLRDLRDIDCMLRTFQNTPGFWDRLVTYAARNDLANPVYLGLYFVQKYFDTPVPEQVLREFWSIQNTPNRPAWWLEASFSRALRPGQREPWDMATELARKLIYMRAHALRMPWPLLMRHLTTKAWLSWREKQEAPGKA